MDTINQNEKFIITLADWKAVRLEITLNSNNINVQAIFAIKPYILKDNAGTEIIQFSQDDLKIMDQFESGLSHLQKKYFPKFSRLYIRAVIIGRELIRDQAGLLGKFSEECPDANKLILNDLGYYDLLSLKSTCRFFSNDKTTSLIKDNNKPKLLLMAGPSKTLLLTPENKLYASGKNLNTQLGIDSTWLEDITLSLHARALSEPITYDAFNKVMFKQITLEYSSSLVLMQDGKLYAAGSDHFWTLGSIEKQNGFKRVLLKKGLKDTPICEVVSSFYHTLLLTNDGKLFGSGENDWGQLGLGHTITQFGFTEIMIENQLENDSIQKIMTGSNNSFILTRNGKLFGCGDNRLAQLGIEDDTTQVNFIELPLLGEALKKLNIAEIVAGSDHFLVLTHEGELYGWGSNKDGQLGLGNTNKQFKLEKLSLGQGLENIRILKVVAGSYFSIALTIDGKLYGCGDNSCAQLGLGHTNSQRSFKEIALGEQLHGIKIQQIASGDFHTMILSEEGQIYGCGSNLFCQLGIEDTENRTQFTFSPLLTKALDVKLLPDSDEPEESDRCTIQ